MAFARPQLAGSGWAGGIVLPGLLVATFVLLLAVAGTQGSWRQLPARLSLPTQGAQLGNAQQGAYSFGRSESGSEAPGEAALSGSAGGGDGSSAGSAVLLPAGWRNSYQFSLTAVEMADGLVSYGSPARARRAMAKLATGQALKMAFLGGSITRGHGADDPGRTDYAARVFDWIHATFPSAHELINGAVAGVPSSYFALCAEWHMPHNPDIVLLELNINDGAATGDAPLRRAHERLLRKILSLPSRPAVVELVFYRYADSEEWESGLSPYRYHGDDEVGVLAQFYRLPWISVRSLVWGKVPETAQDPKAPRSSRFSGMWMIGVDPDHPTDVGHKWLADLVVYWMQQTLEDLQRHPLEPEDEDEAQAELSLPMYRDNWEAGIHTCLMAGQLQEVVTQHDDAFQWVNEGSEQKPKWGYVSMQPGSSLQATIKTKVAKNLGAGDLVSVGVAHLQSYEHMGMFEVACVKGCTCDPLRQDGHNEKQESQMHTAMMLVSASDSCHLKLTVLDETDSGEHKVKLMGIIISEVPGMLLSDAKVQGLSVRYSQGEGGKYTLNVDETVE